MQAESALSARRGVEPSQRRAQPSVRNVLKLDKVKGDNYVTDPATEPSCLYRSCTFVYGLPNVVASRFQTSGKLENLHTHAKNGTVRLTAGRTRQGEASTTLTQ